jgi:hypothetical protein
LSRTGVSFWLSLKETLSFYGRHLDATAPACFKPLHSLESIKPS